MDKWSQIKIENVRQGDTVDIDGYIGVVREKVIEGKYWRLMTDNGVFHILLNSKIEVFR